MAEEINATTTQKEDPYKTGETLIFDIQRDMPLNSLASYLNSCPSELRKRLLKLAFRVYGNSPITNYLSVHTNGEEVKLDKITDKSIISNIEKYIAANQLEENTLILPDDVAFSFISSEEEFLFALSEMASSKELAVHCISSFLVKNSVPSLLLIGSLSKVWIVDILSLNRQNPKNSSINTLYQVIVDHVSTFVYLHRDKHFENIQKGFPNYPSFTDVNNSVDLYDYLFSLYHIDMKPISLSSLLYIFTGQSLDGHQYKSDWNHRPLDFFQTHYAASYVYALISIYTFLKSHPTWEEAGTICHERYEEVLTVKKNKAIANKNKMKADAAKAKAQAQAQMSGVSSALPAPDMKVPSPFLAEEHFSPLSSLTAPDSYSSESLNSSVFSYTTGTGPDCNSVSTGSLSEDRDLNNYYSMEVHRALQPWEGKGRYHLFYDDPYAQDPTHCYNYMTSGPKKYKSMKSSPMRCSSATPYGYSEMMDPSYMFCSDQYNLYPFEDQSFAPNYYQPSLTSYTYPKKNYEAVPQGSYDYTYPPYDSSMDAHRGYQNRTRPMQYNRSSPPGYSKTRVSYNNYLAY